MERRKSAHEMALTASQRYELRKKAQEVLRGELEKMKKVPLLEEMLPPTAEDLPHFRIVLSDRSRILDSYEDRLNVTSALREAIAVTLRTVEIKP